MRYFDTVNLPYFFNHADLKKKKKKMRKKRKKKENERWAEKGEMFCKNWELVM